MIEQTIRPLYQKVLVEPVAKGLCHHLTPLTITIASGVFGLAFIPLIYFNWNLTAVMVLLFSGYLDTLDGTLARLQQSSSSVGSVLDIMMDRLVEFSAIFGLYLLAPHDRATTTIILLGSILWCITSFLVVGIFTPNQGSKGFHYSPGLIERAETFIFIILMVVWPQAYNGLAITLAFLILITTLLRLYQFIKFSSFFDNPSKLS